ncbi:MAG: hypothetical protein DRQ62_15660 [Gammaproteobacteria bacterium]|nr:MAG: hypothetical protein DRQ62_15660 [Gammaproteobacteria bacterium]
MISKISVITVMLALLAVSGCNKDKSVKPDLGKNKTEIILSPGEFQVVKTIHGKASTSFLFWIDFSPVLKSIDKASVPVISFQLDKSNIHERAMHDLHKQHDLQGKPQILHNFLEEWTLANYLGLYAIRKLSISAEVIEFIERDDQ